MGAASVQQWLWGRSREHPSATAAGNSSRPDAGRVGNDDDADSEDEFDYGSRGDGAEGEGHADDPLYETIDDLQFDDVSSGDHSAMTPTAGAKQQQQQQQQGEDEVLLMLAPAYIISSLAFLFARVYLCACDATACAHNALC